MVLLENFVSIWFSVNQSSLFSLRACKFGCLICIKGYIWSTTPDFKIYFQFSLICIIILLKADSLLKRRNFFFFTFIVFLFQAAYILGFYTVDCTCVMCTIAVSLRIPVSNLCVCVCVYCWTRWRMQSYPIYCWKILLFSLWYDRKYQKLIKNNNNNNNKT